MNSIPTLAKTLSKMAILLFAAYYSNAQTNIYWVGGSGDWDDLSHWVKNSGGTNLANTIPNENTNAIIDQNSGLNNNDKITIPPGTFAVNNLIVTNNSGFELLFNGTIGSFVEMNVHGHLNLSANLNLNYTSYSVSASVWNFVDDNNHNINTGNNDLMSVQFFNANGTFRQFSDLYASERIRMHGGVWITNNYDVDSKHLLFQDSNGSSNPIPKIFNAGSSDITCDLWESTFAYTSLTVTGNYKIYTEQFLGSSGTQFENFSFNDIILLDFDDNPTGGSSVVEHNNFVCAYCEIQDLIIRDSSQVKLAGIFTVNGTLEVVHGGTTVLFNGGNAYEDEVIINGSIKTPKVIDCNNKRVIFSNVHDDFTTLTKTSGTLKISDVEIVNIQAQGGATFQAVNSVLQGSSSGWDIVNPPVAIQYEWIGQFGSFANWDDPINWLLTDGSFNGCVPTIVDDVFITNEAKGDIRIPSPYKATCRNFTWTNTKSKVLLLDGQVSSKSELLIAGNFELDATASISADQNHKLIFSSYKTNDIITNGVILPNIYFVGDVGKWELGDNLTCDRIDIEGGTIETQNHDITANRWRSLDNNPKHFIFGSATITVFGEMMLAELPNNNVTVDFGTSLIRCERLTSAVPQLYDVQLYNTNAILMDNWPVEFRKLILSGTGTVGTAHHMTLTDLVFEADDSEFQIHPAWDFNIKGGIESIAAKINPAILRSSSPGTQAGIDKDTGHICVVGYVHIEDIIAELEGVLHAPLGTDVMNNSGVIFDGGANNTDLFWRGGTDSIWTTKANWSHVSGGCPATKDPENSLNLIFDDNSFFSDDNEIVMPPGTNTPAHNVFFYSNEQLTIQANNFYPDNITVLGGDARFEGQTMEVQGNTHVGPRLGLPGLLITDMVDFKTFDFSGNYGIWIIRAGSSATVIGP